jgi:hypothetical protein
MHGQSRAAAAFFHPFTPVLLKGIDHNDNTCYHVL